MLNYFEINDEFVIIHVNLIRISIRFEILMYLVKWMRLERQCWNVIDMVLVSSRIRSTKARFISMRKMLKQVRSGLLIHLLHLFIHSIVEDLLR